ncbi:MAG: hypothetical protein ACJ701_00985 [Nitrososphaera sp.]
MNKDEIGFHWHSAYSNQAYQCTGVLHMRCDGMLIVLVVDEPISVGESIS